MNCSDATKGLWDYLDGAVEGRNQAAIEEHLRSCRNCCSEMEFAEELKNFLVDKASEELPDDARVRLTNYLHQLCS